jgi:hypothetical protein
MVLYLITKIIVEIHNEIYKINNEEFIKYFSSIDYGVHYNLAKSQIKVQLMHGEIKKQIVLRGKLNQIAEFRV